MKNKWKLKKPESPAKKLSKKVKTYLHNNSDLIMKIVDARVTGKPLPPGVLENKIDTTLLRAVFNRIMPSDEDLHYIKFPVPEKLTPETLPSFAAGIIAAVAAGDITPSQGDKLMRLVDTYNKTIENQQIDAMIRELKSAQSEALEAKEELQNFAARKMINTETGKAVLKQKTIDMLEKSRAVTMPKDQYEYVD